MSDGNKSDSSKSEDEESAWLLAMSDANKSDSEDEVSACSSSFNPLKALYSSNIKVPVANAPLYENLSQYESAHKGQKIVPVGHKKLVQKREEDKAKVKLEQQKELEELNKARFSQYQDHGMTKMVRPAKKTKNVLTRIDQMDGPLAALQDCVDHAVRVKVMTRHATGIRGELHGSLVAFDKQWNLAMEDVQEVWRRKVVSKRKVPALMGTPVPKGTAAKISPVPIIVEKPVGKDVVECTRHIKQLMVRGEHVVLIIRIS